MQLELIPRQLLAKLIVKLIILPELLPILMLAIQVSSKHQLMSELLLKQQLTHLLIVLPLPGPMLIA